MRWFHNGDFHLHEHLRSFDDNLSGNVYGSSTCNRGVDLSCKHHNYCLSDASVSKRCFRNVARNSNCNRRLQRCFDKQQYWCTTSLRRFYNSYIHLYEHLRSFDYDLSSDIHGACRPNSDFDLSNQHHNDSLPDSSSSKYCVCNLARNCLSYGRLQWCFNQQQHWRTASMWWFNDRNLHLYQHLCAFNDDLSGDLHRASFAKCCVELPDEHDHGGLPNASGGEHGFCQLACNSKC